MSRRPLPKNSSITEWVAALKASRPDLPDHLSIEVELSRLRRLDGWFDRIKRLRVLYDQMDRKTLPEELRQAGKRQIVPVLMSLETMTDDEVEAWHDLFTCLSAQLSTFAYDYYRAHLRGKDASMALVDVLNYLPAVFLYVLSSYKEYPKGEGTDRVRLITWVHIESRRHINAYMQQHAYTVKRGSGAVHRLKTKLQEAASELAEREGRQPHPHEVVEYVNDRDGVSIDIDPELYQVITRDETYSLHEPAGAETQTTYEDMLEAPEDDVEDRFDPVGFALELARGCRHTEGALIKLFETDDKLSMRERVALGA
jgi:hypothetical protein